MAIVSATVAITVTATGAIVAQVAHSQNDANEQNGNNDKIYSVHSLTSDDKMSYIIDNQSDTISDTYLDNAHAYCAPGGAHFAAGSGKGRNTWHIKQDKY